MFRKQIEIQGATQRRNKEIMRKIVKECYERKKEELSDKKKETFECTICKCEERKYTMKRHEESIKHQMNINGQ